MIKPFYLFAYAKTQPCKCSVPLLLQHRLKKPFTCTSKSRNAKALAICGRLYITFFVTVGPGLKLRRQTFTSYDSFDTFVAGYCGPTCLTSTCTNCDSDIVSGEVTLDLTTGEILGNLPGATVESMAVTTAPGGDVVECNYKARVKVKHYENTPRQYLPPKKYW